MYVQECTCLWANGKPMLNYRRSISVHEARYAHGQLTRHLTLPQAVSSRAQFPVCDTDSRA